uniref:Peptidase M12B domain-containing protein n=1 Tax=Cynoglossus semilaevis TaxID=244447 RepID=A0A3P8WVL5_CYNSE
FSAELRTDRFCLLPQVSYVITVDGHDRFGTLTFAFASQNHCQYRGVVQGEEGSSVAMDICSGLRGVLHLSDDSYGIEPLDSDPERHLVYRLRDVKSQPRGCGTPHDNRTAAERGAEEIHHGQHRRRAILHQAHYVELLLVVDNNKFNAMKRNETAVREKMVQLANLVDSIYVQLNIRVNPISIEGGAGDVLTRFTQWREKELVPRRRHDSAQLILRQGFGGTAGMAFVSTVCSRSHGGGINAFTNNNLPSFASILAHELGHNLGMNHDDRRSCSCPVNACIMNSGATRAAQTRAHQCADLRSAILSKICPTRPFLQTLQLNTSLCLWIKDFLSNRPQRVRMGATTSSNIILNTGVPQGCVLSPVLYTLYTHDCIATHASNSLIKFADDTTIVGLISNNNETPYRKEVQALAAWCSDNHLNLNTKKTKEIIIDFRKTGSTPHSGLSINGEEVEQVRNFKFLGLHISEDLSWTVNTKNIIKKAQQRLFFLRTLRKNKLPRPLLKNFYHCTIESVLTYGCTVWHASCTMQEKKQLQRVIKTAQWIIGSPLPCLEDIHSDRLLRRARKIRDDPAHPGHTLFTTLPSGRLRVLKTRTNRMKNSFFPTAVKRLLQDP